MMDGETERLPWLEPVEEEDAQVSGPSTLRLMIAVILGLALIGALVGGYFWMQGDGPTAGRGELIAAPKGPYKVPPEQVGGMTVEGEGDTAFAASEGIEPAGRIDVGAVPEAPVTEAPGAVPRRQPAERPDAGAAVNTIQLGAFSSEGAANSAWKALSERFSYLAPLTHIVLPVEDGDRTLYRLRATGPDAAGICGRLRVAGEACVAVD
jgi:hypothetical protein